MKIKRELPRITDHWRHNFSHNSLHYVYVIEYII